MKFGNKIQEIISVDDETFKLKLKFSDGTKGEVDLGFIFLKPQNLAAEIVKGRMFAECFVESGALAWANGFELCPDTLRMRLVLKKPRVAG